MIETTVKYKQERIGDYVQVRSGNRFYILDPRKEDLTIDDIAHALANLCRFTGHGERFYCVGEHSIYCALVARKLGLPILTQLYCLLHDGSESIVNDLARPVKQNVPQYMEIEDRIMKVIWEVAGLPSPTQEDYKQVKLIDNTLLVNEMKQLMSRTDIPDVEHHEIYVDLNVKPLNSGESKQPFIDLYNVLINDYKIEQLNQMMGAIR